MEDVVGGWAPGCSEMAVGARMDGGHGCCRDRPGGRRNAMARARRSRVLGLKQATAKTRRTMRSSALGEAQHANGRRTTVNRGRRSRRGGRCDPRRHRATACDGAVSSSGSSTGRRSWDRRRWTELGLSVMLRVAAGLARGWSTAVVRSGLPTELPREG